MKPGELPASYRCPWCDIHWPPLKDYMDCPTCREETIISGIHPTMSESDAHARALEHAFGWYLWDNELL